MAECQWIDGVHGLVAVKARGREAGWTGFPSSSNPYQPDTMEHNYWRDGHFEGQCAAIDEGIRPAP